MTMSSVDLPEPLGPTTAMASPAGTLRSMPRRMATGPAREGKRHMDIFKHDCRRLALFQGVIHGRG